MPPAAHRQTSREDGACCHLLWCRMEGGQPPTAQWISASSPEQELLPLLGDQDKESCWRGAHKCPSCLSNDCWTSMICNSLAQLSRTLSKCMCDGPAMGCSSVAPRSSAELQNRWGILHREGRVAAFPQPPAPNTPHPNRGLALGHSPCTFPPTSWQPA